MSKSQVTPPDSSSLPPTLDHRGRWLPLAMAAAAFAVYGATLAPHLTSAHFGSDGGDLITAAHTLGVPHPPGYPTYTLLAWLFTQLDVGSIAYRVNLLSAVCAASAVGIHCRTAQLLLPAGDHPLVVWASTALMLAFSSLLWSQAVITEVYALLTLFAALLLWLLVRWKRSTSDGPLWLAALILGLGLGNHLTLALGIPAATIMLWPERSRWRRLRTLIPAAGLFAVGLSIYAYLPLAASHDPPVNWGDPQTWSRFLWVVTGNQYQGFVFGLGPDRIPGRVSLWTGVLSGQFGWWGLIIALAGGLSWYRRNPRFLLFSLAWLVPLGLYGFYYFTDDSYMVLLPALLVLTLWWGEGVRRLQRAASRVSQRWPGQGRVQDAMLSLAVLMLPLVSLLSHWPAMDLSDDWSGYRYYTQVLESAAPNALIVVRRDEPTFALWYGIYVEDQRPDVAVVNGRLLAFPWYREQVARRYPHIDPVRPARIGVTTDDLVRDLITRNLSRVQVYATDPTEKWKEWFEFIPEGEPPLYRIQP